MPDTLLLTKLYIPPLRANLVPRPRLIERLETGLTGDSRLTLISAPAGFGKTTLVSKWLGSCRQPVAWLSLDEGDNDPTSFLTYLIAALQEVAPDIGKGALTVLQSPQQPPIESILIAFLNEIATFPDHFILVLDDYHAIDAASIDHILTFVLEHLPAPLHLVITTREDPHLPLARLRARGQLTELRAADLRFTPSEAAEFLNRVMGLNLSAEDIAALETRTEGWIAGLQLAALSMQGRSDAASFIKSFTGSHHFILDYLVEEVLQRQPEHVRSFLLHTAILDRLSGSLCDAVTGQEGGRGMLEALERGNLFVVPLDNQRKWYRYHHLFAGVLQAHLMEVQPDRAAALHGRASSWFEQNGMRSDAILHALAAKDFERAAGLIEQAWPAAEEGSILPATWLSWVKALPEALVHARPVLTVAYAYALLGRGELEAAEASLQDAERWFEQAEPMKMQPEIPSGEMVVVDHEQWKSLPAAVAIGRAYIAQALGNIPDTVRYASRVLELPEADPFRHSQAFMLLGMTYWANGDLEAANRVFADYTMKLRTAGNIPDAISTAVVLADIRLALGRLHEAIRTVEQCLQFVINQGEPIPFDTADLHRELSELYLEQGSLEAAAQHLQKSKELGGKAELPVWRYRWCIAQARLNETLGDLVGALTLLDEAERLYIRTPLSNLRPIPAMKARIGIAQGRLALALQWVQELGLSPDNDLSYLREFEHITLARILITQYQNDRMEDSFHMAMRLLDRLLQAAEEGGRRSSVIEILVLQALTHQELGSITPALAPLERALTLAEPEGYVRVFVDEGPPMIALLREATKHGIVSKYVIQLLTAFEKAEGKKPLTQPLMEPATLREALSERELGVLRLLRTDLSGPEIARELIVSLNTVRTHTQNIYAKLGVNNRRAAVRRAEELDLV